jgi:cytosine/adenosine deaminase-related metal-dependent hydrolase
MIPVSEARPQPGRVNAHTHLYSGLAPLGLPTPTPPPENFVQILERVWWRLDRAIDEASLRASARPYVAEALLRGTTTLVDHHESPGFISGSLDVLAEVCDELGVRAVLCYGATERNDGRREAREGLRECRRFAAANTRSQVRGVVGLHASFTVSDETIAEAGTLCRELGTVLHVHVAEDTADLEDAYKRGYLGPLDRLARLDALPQGSILAHGVHLTTDEVRAAGRRGRWLVQNPRSNEANGVGYADALWASAKVALGTDGFPADMTAEYEALERLSRQHDPEHSSKLILGDRLAAGTLMVAGLFPEDDLALDEILFLDGTSAVQNVCVGGSPVVENGRLVAADIEEIRAHAHEQAALLFRRMESL